MFGENFPINLFGNSMIIEFGFDFIFSLLDRINHFGYFWTNLFELIEPHFPTFWIIVVHINPADFLKIFISFWFFKKLFKKNQFPDKLEFGTIIILKKLNCLLKVFSIDSVIVEIYSRFLVNILDSCFNFGIIDDD